MAWAIPNPQDSSFQFWEQNQAQLWEQRRKEHAFGQKVHVHGINSTAKATPGYGYYHRPAQQYPLRRDSLPYQFRPDIGTTGGFAPGADAAMEFGIGTQTVAAKPNYRVTGGHIIRDVWAWNFDAEFDELLAAAASAEAEAGVSSAVSSRPVIALDTEFPGCLCEDPTTAVRAVRYWALRENVELLRPIQFGLAVAGRDGELKGAWTFNLWFDLATNLYTQEAIRFLSGAGVDFPRHAIEGIDPAMLAWRLARSPLVGCHHGSPRWVTFSGWYDWGYLLKLLTGRPMPHTMASFDGLLAALCPLRHELRDTLPRGSLDSLMAAHGVGRYGAAHTAGSDALLTLELYLHLLAAGLLPFSAGGVPALEKTAWRYEPWAGSAVPSACDASGRPTRRAATPC
jgi:CCR4-NOT transcription complex subunit 7/8